MSDFTEANLESIIAGCSENCAAIAESLNLCFDRSYRIEAGESSAWELEEAPDVLDGPGLAVSLRVGTRSLVCLIPQSLPLPDWYTEPGDSEASRLQTLAMEWSMNLLPPDLEASEFKSIAVDNLKSFIGEAEPAEWAARMELLVFDENENPQDDQPAEGDETSGEAAETAAAETGEGDEAAVQEPDSGGREPAGTMFLVWPVVIAESNAPTDPVAEPDVESSAAPGIRRDAIPEPLSADSAAAPMLPRRFERLLGIPVTVVVRLAEKKIEMEHLLSISPGSLITFSKSCEDMLDLYVNNFRYCRGEAVKIGEKFGLKINEVGVVEERQETVLHG